MNVNVFREKLTRFSYRRHIRCIHYKHETNTYISFTSIMDGMFKKISQKLYIYIYINYKDWSMYSNVHVEIFVTRTSCLESWELLAAFLIIFFD